LSDLFVSFDEMMKNISHSLKKKSPLKNVSNKVCFTAIDFQIVVGNFQFPTEFPTCAFEVICFV
jgi:hypothetical protein